MPSLRLMQPEEVAALHKESKGTGQRKVVEAIYDHFWPTSAPAMSQK
jgi:hypothetical protein